MATANRGAARAGRDGGSADTTVLVVDDQRAFADAVALAVDSQRGLCCVAGVGSAEAALEHVAVECPDVVLLDLRLPGMSGLDAIPLLKDRCPRMRILVLTVDTSRRAIVAAADAGADGFIAKVAPFTDILAAVRADESLLVAEEALAEIVRLERDATPPADGADGTLTEREREVLTHLARGTPVKQVARGLGISVHTCRGHVRAILHKLDAHSQLAAVVTAARRGLLRDLGE
jgi:DNA-binding NarL/FixJ family response regulator